MAVFREKQGDQLRVDAFDGAEAATQEFPDQLAVNGGVVAREMDVFQAGADRLEIFPEQFDLGGLARSVQAFQYDKHNKQRYIFFR